MVNKLPDLQVVSHDKILLKLLEASQAVEFLRKDNECLSAQITAPRSLFIKLMTPLGDLRKEIDYF